MEVKNKREIESARPTARYQVSLQVIVFSSTSKVADPPVALAGQAPFSVTALNV